MSNEKLIQAAENVNSVWQSCVFPAGKLDTHRMGIAIAKLNLAIAEAEEAAKGVKTVMCEWTRQENWVMDYWLWRSKATSCRSHGAEANTQKSRKKYISSSARPRQLNRIRRIAMKDRSNNEKRSSAFDRAFAVKERMETTMPNTYTIEVPGEKGERCPCADWCEVGTGKGSSVGIWVCSILASQNVSTRCHGLGVKNADGTGCPAIKKGT